MTTVPDAELLLSHAGFLRNVARGLLLDDQQADDVVQQVLLAAIEKPPAHTGNLRAWLASVTRNLALMRRRGEGRRRRREESVARPERDPVPTPDEVHARLEMQRRVVDAVMDLREPYKSAVVFRYLDELPPEEIADRLGVPVGTVKSRLKRGLAMLRERFDHEVDGGRQAWRLALLPLAVPMATAQAAAATTTAAALTTTGLLSMKTIVSVASILILAVALLMTQTLSNSDEPTRRSAPVATEDGASSDDPKTARNVDPVEEDAASRDDPGIILLRAIVHDETGQPLEGVHVETEEESREAISGADGRFRIRTERIGTTISIGNDTHGYAMITLSKAGYVRKSGPLFTSASRPTEQVFVMQRGTPLGIRVVDGKGSPVANARVHVTTNNRTLFFDYGMMTSRYSLGDGVTDEDGRVQIAGAPVGAVRVTVVHDAWATHRVTRRIGSLEQTEIEVVVSSGGVIEGGITSPDGKPVVGALVHLDDGKGRSAKSDKDGRYRIDRVRAGEHTVWASAEGFGPGFFGHALGWGEPAGVRVHEGIVSRDIDIPLMAPTVVSGRLLDPDGTPVAGAEIRVFGRDWDAAFTRSAQSDENGRFKVGPLPVDRARALAAAVLIDGYRFNEQEFRVVVITNAYGLAGVSETYADREGNFKIVAGPGETQIHAQHGGKTGAGLSETLTIGVPVGGNVEDVALPLRAVAVIAGRLMNSAGHGRAFHKLGAVPVGSVPPYEKMELAWTNATGDFRFESLTRGKWLVGLVDRHHFNPSNFEKEPEPRVIETGMEGVEFTIPGAKTLVRGRVVSGRDGTPVPAFTVKFLRYRFFVPQDWLFARYTGEDGQFGFDRAGDPGRVRGQIKDAAGAPVAYARIHALNAKLQSNDDRIPFTDADGKFSIDGLAPGPYTLFVVSPRHPLGIHKGIQIREGETTDVALDLDPACPLTLVVKDAEGQPIEGARLIYTFAALQPLNSSMVAEYEPPGFGRNVSGAKGEIRKPFMAAGALVIQVSKQGYGTATKTVSLVAGVATRVEVELNTR